jgi:hypothetical protein
VQSDSKSILGGPPAGWDYFPAWDHSVKKIVLYISNDILRSASSPGITVILRACDPRVD